jgi:uncharacterized membrane protein YiaA
MMICDLKDWAPTLMTAYGSDLPLPRTPISIFIKSLASTRCTRNTPCKIIGLLQSVCGVQRFFLTSGSGVRRTWAGTSSLSEMGYLLGRTIIAATCSIIIRWRTSLQVTERNINALQLCWACVLLNILLCPRHYWSPNISFRWQAQIYDILTRK